MSTMTSTGVKLSVVKGLPTTEDDTGFAALSFIEAGSLVDLPAYGPTVSVVESNPLATGVTIKHAGFVNYGSVALGLELDIEDAGQVILEAGVQLSGVDDPHSFKVEYPDGTIEYFHGGIFAYTRSVGSANSMVGSTVNVEINSAVVRVTA